VSAIPGVAAVSLGGSRAQGLEHESSDWDFCLYYRDALDTGAIRSLGLAGEIYEPADWGRLLNGGAWLHVGGVQVDLLYRDLDFVERCIGEAEAGRFEIGEAQGYIAGVPSYFLVGEVALAKVLVGSLPSARFPDVLRRTAPMRWYASAAFSLSEADFCALRSEPLTCAGLLAKAAVAVAQARLAERGEWTFNEKAILRRAGIQTSAALLARGVGTASVDLKAAVSEMRAALGTVAPQLRSNATP
jgi:predicted nucleotidyltransferase